MKEFLGKISWNELFTSALGVCKGLVIAAGIWFVGKLVIKAVSVAMTKAHAGETVRKFAVSILRVLLYVLTILIILDSFGINTGSLVTMISALGLSLSLALKDNISNIADGIFLLVASPFKVGDIIEVDGVSGKVANVSVYYTKLETADKAILIPNNKISKATVTINSEQ